MSLEKPLNPQTPGLLRLVCDLLELRDVRARFNDSPAKVAKDYGLKPAETGALFSMDGAVIGTEIGSQLAGVNYQFMENEFPVLGPEFSEDPGVILPEYPSPKPAIYRISPTQHTHPAPPVDFAFNVFGQSFSRNAEIVLEQVNTGVKPALSNQHVFGTFRCGHAFCMVKGGIANGTYKIKVVNAPGSGNPTTIDGNALRLVVS